MKKGLEEHLKVRIIGQIVQGCETANKYGSDSLKRKKSQKVKYRPLISCNLINFIFLQLICKSLRIKLRT
jgi:hypothetical protein